MINKKMRQYTKITISIHPIELNKLDKIKKENKETRSGMIQRLIRDYQLKEPIKQKKKLKTENISFKP